MTRILKNAFIKYILSYVKNIEKNHPDKNF